MSAVRGLVALTGMLLAVSAPPHSASAATPPPCWECADAGAELQGNRSVEAHKNQLVQNRGRAQTVESVARERTGGSDCPSCTYSTISLSEAQSGDRIPARAYESCPPAAVGRGETRFLYRSRPGAAAVEYLGVICTFPAGPAQPAITLAMVEAELRRLVQQVAPTSTQIGFAPSTGAIVNLPTIVYATPQDAINRNFTPFGIPVRVSLTPTWEWTFEPGAHRQTATPGQPYQDNGVPVAADPAYVTHTYRTPGSRTVTVTVHWAASYALPGGSLTPLGELTRADSATMSVREAPSRLDAR